MTALFHPMIVVGAKEQISITLSCLSQIFFSDTEMFFDFEFKTLIFFGSADMFVVIIPS